MSFIKKNFYAVNPYNNEFLKIIYPDYVGNFLNFDFKDYDNLDKIEIWFIDENEQKKRITTILNLNYKT
jgi:hypothetical protein